MKIEDIIKFCKTYFLNNLDKRYVSVSYGLPSPTKLDKNKDGLFEDQKYQVYLNSENKGIGHIIIRLDINLDYNEEIIPEYVNINDFSIPTYVIKTQRFSRTCTDAFFDQVPPLNRNTFRPILGGISVANFDSQQVIGGYFGTLGCLALDNDTTPPSVVSLSNNHVYSHDMLIAGSRDPNLIYTDHYDDDIIQSFLSSESGGNENTYDAPDFTATDINGITHSLYSDYLDQGKGVIIDFFATWCGPCWNYKETGALEEAYQAFGPNGTDQITVLAIEASSTTSTDELYNSSFGDWTAGVTHPIINANEDLISLYSQIVFGYPTIIYICPNGTWSYIGQPNFQEINTIINEGGVNCNPVVFDGTAIGKFKKSWRLRPWIYPQFENLNPGDVAVSTLYTTDPSGEPIIYSGTQGSDIGENNSWYQLNLFDGPEDNINFNVNDSPLKWAATFELNNLMSVNLDGSITIEKRLYTTGARMGPWGVSNIHTDFGDSLLVPIELGAQVGVPYLSQGYEWTNTICNIENCVIFKSTDDPVNYESTCVPATLGGNSGSALVAEFEGEYKIVGLLFAGSNDGTYGIFCRIDEVASALNLSPFTSETTEFMISNVNQTEIIDLPEPFSNEQYLEVDGKKYWQTGIVQY